MSDLIIIIPAYNEEENIRDVIIGWHPVVEKIGGDSKLVVIDDGSKDSTYSIMKEMISDFPYLVPLTKDNSGHGATLLFGYEYALENGAKYIFQTDSDGQTLPEEFFTFWEVREKYDLIIGHRNHRKDGLSRVFVTNVLKLVVLLFFGEAITDANTPFRLYSSKSLQELIGYVPENFNLSNVILTVIYKKFNYKIKFYPITFRERQGGVNSINFKKISVIGKKAIKDFIDINRNIKRAKNDTV